MLGLLVAGFIALIIFIYLAIAVLPKATITLNTTSVPVSTSLTLTTSGASSLNEANSTIPAVLKTTQQTANAQVTATGQQNNGVKATGTVTMTATESGATAPSSVPAGAGITSGGLTYITAATTKFDTTHATNNLNGTFTYQATSTTGITAQTGGTNYNVSGATFAVSGRPDVSASGSTSGGTDSIVTVVSQNDLDGAKGTITSAASAAFIKTYEASLASQGLYVLTSTLTTSDPTETASPAVGQAASTTNVTVQMTYTLLTIKKSDLQQALADALTKKIDKSQQSVDTNSVLSNATVAVQDQSSPTVATLSITGSASAVPVINAVSVKTQVSGKKSADIINSLEAIPGVKTVNVKFSPFWVSKVPSKPSKITIVQQYTKGTSQ